MIIKTTYIWRHFLRLHIRCMQYNINIAEAKRLLVEVAKEDINKEKEIFKPGRSVLTSVDLDNDKTLTGDITLIKDNKYRVRLRAIIPTITMDDIEEIL